MSKVIHHWRWRSPRYLLTCGAKNGLISQHNKEPVSCKSCIRVMSARGWKMPTPTEKEE